MNIKDLVNDKTCYIISNELKNEILQFINENKLLLDVHFFSLNEIIDRVYFKYDNRAIYYVSKEFNLSYDNAKVMIDNLKYLMYSLSLEDYKIQYLKKIKSYLDKNNLLTYDYNFISYLKSYNLISDLSNDNPFLYKINELLDQKIKFLSLKEKDNITILEFKSSDDEIAYLANEICDLLSQNISPNKIHVVNANKDYKVYIDKIFTLYNIPYHLNIKNKLFELDSIKKIYKSYLNNEDYTCYDNELVITFNNIVNSLTYIENETDKNNFLLYLLKNTSFKEKRYKEVINFSSFESLFLDNHYYFFVGLNNKVFPNYIKDEDYLSDDIKTKLGYITSVKINEIKRNFSLNRLKSDTKLTISYRNSDYFNAYLKSDLVSLITTKPLVIENTNKYSRDYDRLRLTRELDDFYKYDTKSKELIDLLTKLEKDDYKAYNNKYSKIDKQDYFTKINKKISISYSSFEKFNECKYKYYLDSLLKEKDDNFNTYIGTLFHYILEKVYDKDFDFDRVYNSFESSYTLTLKEELLLNNLINDFKSKINAILVQYNFGDFKIIKKEQKISIKRKTNLSIDINGYIDKIMFDNENHAYIVDYKTGDKKLTLDFLEYGIRCQLPFYFYLLKKSEEYANVFLVGCYLQMVTFKLKNYTDKSKDLLLEGLTYNDEKIVSKIDKFYENDSFIKGIKPNKTGLGSYAKTFNDEDFNHIIEAIDVNIEKMINDIDNVDFSINPKIIKNKETTCMYCNYKDICYRNFKDYIDIRRSNEDGLD